MRFLLERRFRSVHRVQELRPLSQVGQGLLGTSGLSTQNLCQVVRQHNVAWRPWKSAIVVEYPGLQMSASGAPQP